VSKRSARKIRSARNTAKGPDAVMNAIATTRKSNTFQPSLKKRMSRWISLAPISIQNTVSANASNASNNSPYLAVTAFDVSSPKLIALSTMISMIKYCTRGCSTMAPMRARGDRETDMLHLLILQMG